jgi:hypothetical protein
VEEVLCALPRSLGEILTRMKNSARKALDSVDEPGDNILTKIEELSNDSREVESVEEARDRVPDLGSNRLDPVDYAVDCLYAVIVELSNNRGNVDLEERLERIPDGCS